MGCDGLNAVCERSETGMQSWEVIGTKEKLAEALNTKNTTRRTQHGGTMSAWVWMGCSGVWWGVNGV